MPLSEGVLAAERTLSLLAGGASEKGVRRDTLRNKRRLLAAASELVREGSDLNMQSVASRADIAIATAYRHYSSIDDLISAYVLTVIDDLADYSLSSKATGTELLADVLEHWIDLIQAHGHVMVNFRSRRGFLARLTSGDPTMCRVQQAWTSPIDEFLSSRDLSPTLAHHALFLTNQLFDPRDVLDLLGAGGHPRKALSAKLQAQLEGALRGWAAHSAE